jgi:hypothetical protein
MAGYDVTQAPHAPSALSTAYSQPGNANQGPRHVNETKLAEWGKGDNTHHNDADNVVIVMVTMMMMK